MGNICKDRLMELHLEYKNQVTFAEYLELPRQTLGNYLSGKRTPTPEILQRICKKCNVSADWLLGLSDVRTPNVDIQSACKTFGLSEKAGRMLQKDPDFFNWFLCLPESFLMEASHSFRHYIFCLQNLEDLESGNYMVTNDGRIVMPGYDAVYYFADRTGNAISAAMKQMLKENDADGKS